EVDVPDDNHCLFWSATLALLLPRLNDAKAFRAMYLRLFGRGNINLVNKEAKSTETIAIEADDTIEGVRNLLHTYDCEKNTPKRYEGKILETLVTRVFRGRTVDMLSQKFPNEHSREGILVAAKVDNPA